MLDEYYDLHGWDRETSYPKRQTLIDLGLTTVADDLAKIGKLGTVLCSRLVIRRCGRVKRWRSPGRAWGLTS